MHKKKIILYILLILSVIVLIYLSVIVYKDTEFKLKQENNEKSMYEFIDNNKKDIFTIDKITYFSSANGTSTINSNSSFNITNLDQYTDIAIFINNHASENFTLENTLKSVKLSEIKFNLSPTIGSAKLYYKNINNFAKPEYDKNQEINDNLEFSISSEDELDYSNPALYNNCANPITISYVNSNIKENYTLTENISNISYDGSLLKKCNITLNSISCEISFIITIVNNLDEVFTCPVILQIPLSTENSTVYDGSLTLKQDVNYKFIKNSNIKEE